MFLADAAVLGFAALRRVRAGVGRFVFALLALFSLRSIRVLGCGVMMGAMI